MPERHKLTRAAERIGLALALVGIVIVVAWMLTLSQESSARAAEAQAEKAAEVEQCFAEATAAPGLHNVLTAVEIALQNQLVNLDNRLSRQATIRALEDLQGFHARAQATAPTVRECRTLADRLGVGRRT